MHQVGARRRLVWSVVAVIVLALMGCGGGGDNEPAVAGSYSGTIQDSSAGAGTVILAIAQDGSDLTGTWQTRFANAANNNGGTLTGELHDASVSLTLQPSNPATCSFSVTGTFVTSTEIQGTYVAINCIVTVTGTFDVQR